LDINQSAHCAKFLSRSRLFPDRRSERKFWWENGIRRSQKRKKEIIEHPINNGVS